MGRRRRALLASSRGGGGAWQHGAAASRRGAASGVIRQKTAASAASDNAREGVVGGGEAMASSTDGAQVPFRVPRAAAIIISDNGSDKSSGAKIGHGIASNAASSGKMDDKKICAHCLLRCRRMPSNVLCSTRRAHAVRAHRCCIPASRATPHGRRRGTGAA
jgi:hypothetical protein